MLVRPYRLEEVSGLARLYRDAVLELAVGHYDEAQRAQWASWAAGEEFAPSLADGLTLVAEIDGQPGGFGQLHPEHHVRLLYTSPDYTRRGCATAVYRSMERHARECRVQSLTTDASRVSRPLFEKEGFRVIQREVVDRGGVSFERIRMVKDLAV